MNTTEESFHFDGSIEEPIIFKVIEEESNFSFCEAAEAKEKPSHKDVPMTPYKCSKAEYKNTMKLKTNYHIAQFAHDIKKESEPEDSSKGNGNWNNEDEDEIENENEDENDNEKSFCVNMSAIINSDYHQPFISTDDDDAILLIILYQMIANER